MKTDFPANISQSIVKDVNIVVWAPIRPRNLGRKQSILKNDWYQAQTSPGCIHILFLFNGHLILTGMKRSTPSRWIGPFHSDRNGMGHFIAAKNGMDLFTPGGMKWTRSLPTTPHRLQNSKWPTGSGKMSYVFGWNFKGVGQRSHNPPHYIPKTEPAKLQKRFMLVKNLHSEYVRWFWH